MPLSSPALLAVPSFSAAHALNFHTACGRLMVSPPVYSEAEANSPAPGGGLYLRNLVLECTLLHQMEAESEQVNGRVPPVCKWEHASLRRGSTRGTYMQRRAVLSAACGFAAGSASSAAKRAAAPLGAHPAPH